MTEQRKVIELFQKNAELVSSIVEYHQRITGLLSNKLVGIEKILTVRKSVEGLCDTPEVKIDGKLISWEGHKMVKYILRAHGEELHYEVGSSNEYRLCSSYWLKPADKAMLCRIEQESGVPSYQYFDSENEEVIANNVSNHIKMIASALANKRFVFA